MIDCTRLRSPTAGWKPCGWRQLSAARVSSMKARSSVPSTDTPSSSLLEKAMNRPALEKMETKSVRLKQATEAVLVSDAAAGLAENRRSDKQYNKQADRAVKETVDKWIAGNGGSNVPKDDDETVTTDLGDHYQEIHNYGPQGGAGVAGAAGASGSLLKKALPWVLAAAIPATGALGAAAGALGGWYFSKPSTPAQSVNVKDVQSKAKFEVYDETGKLVQTLPYSEMPKQ